MADTANASRTPGQKLTASLSIRPLAGDYLMKHHGDDQEEASLQFTETIHPRKLKVKQIKPQLKSTDWTTTNSNPGTEYDRSED